MQIRCLSKFINIFNKYDSDQFLVATFLDHVDMVKSANSKLIPLYFIVL